MSHGKEARSIMLPCDHHGNPNSYIVGMHGVTRIYLENLDFGDHGIALMEVCEGEKVVLSAPLKHCSFVEWKFDEEKP